MAAASGGNIDPQIRHQLAVLAGRRSARDLGWPRDWRPGEVRRPSSLDCFTSAAAWDLIAEALEDGHPVETIVLDNPPGKTGYVMLIELEPGAPHLYVKLELGSGKILGRSFHYSETKKS